jgi:hypothetical protein
MMPMDAIVLIEKRCTGLPVTHRSYHIDTLPAILRSKAECSLHANHIWHRMICSSPTSRYILISSSNGLGLGYVSIARKMKISAYVVSSCMSSGRLCSRARVFAGVSTKCREIHTTTSSGHNARFTVRNAGDALTTRMKWLHFKQLIIVRTESLVCTGLRGGNSSKIFQTKSLDS